MSLRCLLYIILSLLSFSCFSCSQNDFLEDSILYVENDSSQDSIKDSNKDSINEQNTHKNDSIFKDSTKTSNNMNTNTTYDIDTLFTNNRAYINISKISKYMNQSGAGQGASSHGDYLFHFLDNNSGVNIYNLKEKKHIERITLQSNANNHCNNVSFSNIFYHENDEFPLLYVSGSRVRAYEHVQVYRITRANSHFNITQVQEITLPTSTSTNGLYWTGVIMDNEDNYMYVYANTGKAHIVKFKIPNPYEENVTLSDNDILEQFQVEKFTHQQGAVMRNGIIYVFDGVPSWGDTNYLRIIGVKDKKNIATINITDKGLKAEPEGAFIYNNELYCATNNAGIFKIDFSTAKED